MKKVIPFNKEIEFNSMLNKITSLSLEHSLRTSENNKISGDFIVKGTYKQTEASQIDEEFSYKIPVEINIDSKYDTSDLIIDIDKFIYDIEDSNKLSLDIDLLIDNLNEIELIEDNREENIELEDKNETISEESDLFLETDDLKSLDINTEEEDKDKKINNDNSLFTNFNDNVETFSTYSIYLIKEEDTIESIMKEYKVSKEDLEEYNNLKELKTGSKIIIPCSKNE